MQMIRTFFVGIALGIANVIPGVSGGTIAVVFNVYERIVSLISLGLKKILKDLPFVITIGLGLATGILFFSNVITWLFDRYPGPVYYFFTGIIVGSLPFMYSRVGKKVFSPFPIMAVLIGFAVMVVMALTGNTEGTGNEVVTSLSLPVFFWLFFLGTIGAFAMIIPGISGSLIILALGGYRTVIGAVSDFNIPLMIPIGLGVLCGLFAGAALIRFILARAPTVTYSLILGLVAGSVLPLYPGLPAGVFSWALSLAALCAGAFVSWFFSKTESPARGTTANEGVRI